MLNILLMSFQELADNQTVNQLGDPIATGKYPTIRQIISHKYCVSRINYQRNDPLFQSIIDKLRVDKLFTK